MSVLEHLSPAEVCHKLKMADVFPQSGWVISKFFTGILSKEGICPRTGPTQVRGGTEGS